MKNELKPIKHFHSLLLFLIPGVVFWAVQNRAVPYFSTVSGLSPYVVWLITGTFFLFFPIFLLALFLAKRDGYSLNWSTISERFRIRKVTRKDLAWILCGLLVSTAFVGVIIGILILLPINFDINALKETSPIKVEPLIGKERFALLLLPILFFFNYVGEEILWRGYIFPRQELVYGNYAWFVSALLHLVFHFSFSFIGLVVSLPFLFLIPIVVQKTKNTTNGIIIHALIGAPIQILAALGLAA